MTHFHGAKDDHCFTRLPWARAGRRGAVAAKTSLQVLDRWLAGSLARLTCVARAA